jgi:hypothetical protein
MAGSGNSVVEAQLVLRELHQLLDITQTSLIEYIQDKEKALTEEDVKKIITALKERPEIFPQKVKRAINIDEIQKFGRDAFSRILVERFEKLIFEPSGRSLKQGALPRWMIPGFLEGVRLLIGVQAYREYRKSCADIVERLQDTREDLVDPEFWRRLYRDEEAAELANRVYAQMSIHLANYPKRKKWFLNIINEYVESANREKPENKRHKWRMKETHFVEMMTRIYVAEVKKMKPRSDIVAAVKKYHPDGGMERFEKLMVALKVDIKDVLSQNRALS